MRRLDTHSQTKPRGVLTPLEWAEMHDALTLAIDALGEGPAEVDQPFLLNCITNQRIALKIAHARLEKLK